MTPLLCAPAAVPAPAPTTPAVLTVVRLPAVVGAPTDPIARVLAVVGRVDLDLADTLHRPLPSGDTGGRPYSVVRRPGGTLDVVACRDDLASALLRGEPAARIVARQRWSDLVALDAGRPVERNPRLALVTPLLLRRGGCDYLLPDPAGIVGQALEGWRRLGWPELPGFPRVAAHRLGAWPLWLARATLRRNDRTAQEGVRGVVHLDLGTPGTTFGLLDDDARRGVWALLRLAEWRGAGRHRTYGLGRIVLLREGERWSGPSQRPPRWTPWDGGVA